MESGKDLIIGYLEREQRIRVAAVASMNAAEVQFKLNADQKALSEAVIDDLLQDLVDVEVIE